MHRLIFGHSFAEVVALILLPGLALYILNKKKASVRGKAEDYGSDASGSSTTPIGTNSDGSSSAPTATTNGASSSSTAPFGDRYDVFLSFRGRDTRDGFADHLYHGLDDARINTFRDNEKLRRGKKIGDDLFAAIKNSKILIPILSVNYGTSSWCLNELVQIMECEKNNKETIMLPIFYKVEPSDVRYQTGKFGEAFHDRVKRRSFDSTILKKWKEALEEVSSLKGHSATGPEGELVKSVVREVLSELIAKFELDIPENLVGIGSHVEEVMKFIANSSRATLFVGIHGMGGIGKTTLAKTIYNLLLNQFECHSFIANIREKYKNGVEHLQNKLIHDILKKENLVRDKDEGIKLLSSNFKDKKVLIVLDDMDADDHLKYLAGSHDWFSSGSVIIITTRDESILDKACVDHKYDHQVLDKDSSLILLSRHAFRKNTPSEFKELADEVVSTTGGLPLSLKVLGSFLCDKLRGVWEDTIKQLRNVPVKEVRETLKISYDALEDEQQQIFLDIACFFIGTDLRIASYMWDACDFYPKKGIEVLRLRSLIKVEEDQELRMHDQLRDFGREIVCLKGKREPKKRSRLWDPKEAMEVLKENEGTEKIEAIYLGQDSSVEEGDNILTGKQFKKLRNLRFLGARGAQFSGDFKNSIKKLKWLQWENCPSTFEADNFHVEELRVLYLQGDNISNQWRGWSFITMAKKLKYLNLSHCESLQKTSFLSAFANLEVLILKYCCGIEQIDSSVGKMKSLVRLDLGECRSLEFLPAEVAELKALEQLYLNICLNLFSLPDGIWDLQNLQVLDISCTGIKKLPDSIGALQNLEKLDIGGTEIKELPNGIGTMRKLRELDASLCGQLESIRDSIGALQNLEKLNISNSGIKELPNGIGRLRKLRELDASFCGQLESIRDSIGALQNLEKLNISYSGIKELPNDIGMLRKLRELDASFCGQLESIHDSIGALQNLEKLNISYSGIKELSNGIGRLRKLRELDASGCFQLGGEMPESIHNLSSLQRLLLTGCSELQSVSELPSSLTYLGITCRSRRLPSLSNLTHLKELYLHDCRFLECIWEHPSTPLGKSLITPYELEILGIENCELLKTLDVSLFTHLRGLSARRCPNLLEIRGLDKLRYLEGLDILYCGSIERLDLPESKGLDRLESLEEIDISGCASIQRLDLSKSKGLKVLSCRSCEKLFEIQGLEGLEFLEKIDVFGCASIQRLDLSKSKGLKVLYCHSCKKLVEIQGLDGLKFLQGYGFERFLKRR